MKINNFEINKWSTYKELVIFLATIIPILGILHQSVRLILISPEYLSFFSVTQVVPDTLKLLYLFLLPTLFLVVFATIANLNAEKKFREFDNSNFVDYENYTLVEHLKTNKSDEVLISVKANEEEYFKFYRKMGRIFMIVVLIVYFLGYRSKNDLFDILMFKGWATVFIPFFIFSFLMQFKYFFKNPDKLLIITLVALYLTIIIKNDTFLYRDPNIENFKFLKSEFFCEHYFNTEPKILYFNDKYIFIQTNCDDKKKIFVKDFDSLLKNTPQ